MYTCTFLMATCQFELPLLSSVSANLHFLSCRQIVSGILSTLWVMNWGKFVEKVHQTLSISLLIKVVTKLVKMALYGEGEGAAEELSNVQLDYCQKQTRARQRWQTPHTYMYMHTHLYVYKAYKRRVPERLLESIARIIRCWAKAFERTRLEIVEFGRPELRECGCKLLYRWLCTYVYILVRLHASFVWKLIKKTNELNANEWTDGRTDGQSVVL